MPLWKRTLPTAGAAATLFRAPTKMETDANDDPLTDAKCARISGPDNGVAGSKRQREVVYPDAKHASKNNITAERLSKRACIDYHQPEAVQKKGAAAKAAANGSAAGMDDDDNDVTDANVSAAVGASSVSHTVGMAIGMGVNAAEPNLASESTDPMSTEDIAGEPRRDIVSRYPVSPYGKLYFQVETDSATRHESVGIIIIDTEELGVMMYDRVGRQFGNRPEPGYPVKQVDVEQAKAGHIMKVAGKNLLLITALREEVFLSGEFFLQTEHDSRVKEDTKKAKAEAVAAATAKETKPKMTFGTTLCGSMFTAQIFRRRPLEGQTGFVVPLAGRPKVGKNGLLEDLSPLHNPDRPEAVVLFRADYKRDSHGRRQVSVVVDPVIGDKLRPHQRIGVKFLFDCIIGERMAGYHGAILADEMGLGKTIQTVATIFTCLKQGKFGRPTARKCLVVTPSSLVRNWCNEFDKWLGVGTVKHFAISESTPKGDRIISRFDGEGDVLVISYDQLRKYISRISGLKSVELVVCDEGHRLKNAEVKTTKAVDMLPTRNRVILSGTPIQNDLSEFHAMVGFVNPGILGNRDLFSRVFEEPIMLGRDPDCPDHQKELGRNRAHYLSLLTQRFILRRTQSINESYLPPKVDVTVFVRLGPLQQEVYEKMSSIAETASCTPLVLISALRKLCNHMDLFCDAVKLSNEVSASNAAVEGKARRGPPREGIPRSILPKGYKPGDLSESSGSKLHFVSLMLEELRQNGDRDKLVIVSNFTQTLDIIAALCKRKKISFFQLDGSTPIKKRQELVDYFNVPGSQEIVFLLSSKAGGVGLNLIGANRLILFDPDWNPANDAQAMGRVWRDGQKKRVFIYRLLSTGTIEEKIYQRQVSKQGLSANVVDMQEDSKQHFTLEELRSLFAFKADTLCDTHDLLGCTSCEAAAELSHKHAEVKNAKMQFRRVGQKKSGPRMDELKAWRHFCSMAAFPLDKVIQIIATAAPNLLSFLFADERDTQKNAVGATVQEVVVERPFQNDENQIICASQVTLQDDEVNGTQIEVHSDDEEEEMFESSEDEDD